MTIRLPYVAQVVIALLAMPFLGSSLKASDGDNGIANFRRMKYGFFTHYTWSGFIQDGTRNPDGSFPAGLDDVANRFDAAGFANDLQSMGVEYVIFTAWHANLNCLWPSVKVNQWLSGHTSQRDLLGEMIDAVKAKGIHVLFYTHPRCGHGLSQADQIATGWNGTIGDQPDYSVFDRLKWNNFINDLYGEFIDRYGSKIDGLFIDEGSVIGDSWTVVDYPRLRQTIKSRQPDLLMMQNFWGSNYSSDIGATEINYWGAWVPGTDPDNWPATARPMSMVMAENWYATLPPGSAATHYNPTEMFRLTVLRAGVNSTEGGGINWAAGPYPGGGWETGVLAEMQQIGAWLGPIRRSICNTYPSQSWITPPNSTINSLTAGIVATRAADDNTEFIHVLRAPAGSSLVVPAPADGRGYKSASLLSTGHPVAIARNRDGSLAFTLQGTDTWDPCDTVIALAPVSVTWIGNDQTNGPDTGVWDGATNNFVGGAPVSSRFRGGDNVSFSGSGASNVIFAPSNDAVGDLSFSGKDYNIYPQASAVITLASGRFDVAGGVNVTIHEAGFAGSLRLSGTNGLTKTGGGTLVLDLLADYTGSTLLTDGVLTFSNASLGNDGNIVFNGGTLRYLAGNNSDISARIRHSTVPIRIDTNGNDVTFATPLSATNTGGLVKLGAGTLSLTGGLNSSTSLIVVADGSLRLDPGTNAIATIPNHGFESPAYEPQGWNYNPTGSGWTFSEDSGIASNGSPWINVAPEGVQSAFLQNNGTLSTVASVAVSGNYVLSFKAANRPSYQPSGLVARIDDSPTVSLPPGEVGSGGDFNRFQSTGIHLESGDHTLTFAGIRNGDDTDTIVDDISLAGVPPGALPASATFQLAGSNATFESVNGVVTLSSLAGVAGSLVLLTGSGLIIDGNDPTAIFAGRVTGTGSVTNKGTLRLVGEATLEFSGSFTNHGLLDLMTWNGILPAGFVNDGVVLDRSAVRVSAFAHSGNALLVTITGYTGHAYQLQRSDTLNSGWQNIANAVQGANAPIVFSDANSAPGARYFYRVVVSP